MQLYPVVVRHSEYDDELIYEKDLCECKFSNFLIEPSIGTEFENKNETVYYLHSAYNKEEKQLYIVYQNEKAQICVETESMFYYNYSYKRRKLS